MRTAKPWVDAADSSVVETTTINVLWYNVFGANDAAAKLGGNPYSNHDRWYWGSDNDLLLNVLVRRYKADPVALRNLRPYQTSDNVTIPLVTLHTTGDEIIPFWHELLYAGKARPSRGSSLVQIPTFRFGHCEFEVDEILTGFGVLVLQVTGQHPRDIPQQIDPQKARRDFERAKRESVRAMPAE